MTNNNWDSESIIGIDKGGTGVSSKTAYAIQCGGTTSTGPQQSIASVGSASEVLTSNGAGALPTFQTAPAGGGSWVLVQTQTVGAAVATIDFTGIDATYEQYVFLVNHIYPSIDSTMYFRVGTGAGPTYQAGAGNYSWLSTQGSSASDTKISVITNAESTSTGRGCNFILFLSQPANSGIKTQLNWNGIYYTLATVSQRAYGIGQYNSDTAVTAVRFLFSTGDISYGSISMYGLVTS